MRRLYQKEHFTDRIFQTFSALGREATTYPDSHHPETVGTSLRYRHSDDLDSSLCLVSIKCFKMSAQPSEFLKNLYLYGNDGRADLLLRTIGHHAYLEQRQRAHSFGFEGLEKITTTARESL